MALAISSDFGSVVGFCRNAAGVSQPVAWFDTTRLGIGYCDYGLPNSTGCLGHLTAQGSVVAAANSFDVTASRLPLASNGFFLVSRNQGDTYPVNNSQGRLCLGGFIGRYVGPGQIKNSGSAGSFSLAIDLTSMPQPFGNVAVQPGETWNFQAWYRDANPGATSNFTDAVSVTFQ